MVCTHSYELDLDGLVICAVCKHVVDEPKIYQNVDIFESQMSFEE
jgi:hypothetical protein